MIEITYNEQSLVRAKRLVHAFVNWPLHVRGLRLVHPPKMSAPVIVGDNYVVQIDTEIDPIAHSFPGWDADGRETWEYPA